MVEEIVIARSATRNDCNAIAMIYNQGIADRLATFETEPRSTADIESWFDGKYPTVVVEQQERVIGFAATFSYRNRACYAGVCEFSVYVARESRGRGVGRLAMQELIRQAECGGFWKLVSRVFPENQASLKMLGSLGFREVGIYKRHGQLDGKWRDVMIVELLLEE